MDFGNTTESLQLLTYAIIGLGVVTMIAFVCLLVFISRAAINPQIHVDRVRKQRGIDPMTYVSDKKTYFRFIRQMYITACLFLIASNIFLASKVIRLPALTKDLLNLDADLSQELNGSASRAIVVTMMESMRHTKAAIDLTQKSIELKQAGKIAEAEALQSKISERLKQAEEAGKRNSQFMEIYKKNNPEK